MAIVSISFLTTLNKKELTKAALTTGTQHLNLKIPFPPINLD
ncbi:hypothetical protein [Ancylomarina sp. 16SWW S1-10-2]|nr:hypothetical protein [Ancylomarina sp. 16SWW S1-10-2]